MGPRKKKNSKPVKPRQRLSLKNNVLPKLNARDNSNWNKLFKQKQHGKPKQKRHASPRLKPIDWLKRKLFSPLPKPKESEQRKPNVKLNWKPIALLRKKLNESKLNDSKPKDWRKSDFLPKNKHVNYDSKKRLRLQKLNEKLKKKLSSVHKKKNCSLRKKRKDWRRRKQNARKWNASTKKDVPERPKESALTEKRNS